MLGSASDVLERSFRGEERTGKSGHVDSARGDSTATALRAPSRVDAAAATASYGQAFWSASPAPPPPSGAALGGGLFDTAASTVACAGRGSGTGH